MCSKCARRGPTRVCVCGRERYCGVVCQKDHWKEHKQDCPNVVLRMVEGKGMGLISTRKIKAGKVIIKENPIIKHVGWVENIQEFLEKFQELPVEMKIRYISLYDPEEKSKVVNKDMLEKVEDIGEGASAMFKVWRILWANGVCIGEKAGSKVKGVYHTISRINHSCKANVVFGLEEPENDSMIITTCRDINKNEEILLNYIGAESIFNTKQERQDELQENWYFRCECEVCSKTREELKENEEIRRNIKMCKEKIRNCVEPKIDVTEKALAMGKQKLVLMHKIKEEVLAAFPFTLMDCYGQARIIEFFGGEVDEPPEMYKDQAIKMSTLLGPSTRSVCKELEEETDQIILRWRKEGKGP